MLSITEHVNELETNSAGKPRQCPLKYIHTPRQHTPLGYT